MLTQVPKSRQQEEQPQLPDLCNRLSTGRVDGLMCPFLFPEPMGGTEFEALVLARCFSLARARARVLRQIEEPIVDLCADRESARAVASECLEPGRGECIAPQRKTATVTIGGPGHNARAA
jgi:hypothetical protein